MGDQFGDAQGVQVKAPNSVAILAQAILAQAILAQAIWRKSTAAACIGDPWQHRERSARLLPWPSGPGNVFCLEGSTISVPGMRAGWGASSGTLRVPGESAPNLKSSDSQLPPPPTADLNDKPLTKLNKPLTNP